MAVFLVPVEEGRPIVLDKAVMLIGRQADCDVVLSRSRRVSRRHCCIAQVDNRFVVRDLGSMNGVRVNGKRIDKEAEVRIGDVLTIGDLGFVVQSKEVARSRHARQLADRAKVASVVGAGRNPRALELSQDFPVAIPEADVPYAAESFEGAEPAGESFSDPRRHSTAAREKEGARDDMAPRDADEYHGSSSHIELLPD